MYFLDPTQKTEEEKKRKVELHRANFYLWQKYWTRWTTNLPRAQLNVHRRTANISVELASSSISVFLFQETRAKKCWGNYLQADSVFCFTHYLSVNTLEALDSKTNNYRNKSARLQNFARGKNCWILSKRTLQRLWHILGQGWELESITNKRWKTSTPVTMFRWRTARSLCQNRATCALRSLLHNNTPQRMAALADFVLVLRL